MREAFGQFSTEMVDEAEASPSLREIAFRPEAPVVLVPVSPPTIERSVYGERRFGWPAVVAVVLGHAVALAAVLSFGAVTGNHTKRPPLVIKLLELPADPPPNAPPPPEKVEIVPEAPEQPVIIAPPPVVRAPVVAPMVVTAPQAPPPRTVVVAAPSAPPAPAGPVAASDLSTSMISARPPKYPIESRRKREQGTVVLSVLVNTIGSVAEVRVSRSSGFARLDKAALDAIRHWRWSPNVRGGQPVMVKGFVDIPFVLEG